MAANATSKPTKCGHSRVVEKSESHNKKMVIPSMTRNTKTPKTPTQIEVKMSGDPWDTSGSVLVTLPLPNDVIITKVTGNFTERDRKLWSFLVSAVWDDLLTKRYHEIKVAKINAVFEALSGDTSSGWIWESARRLSKTVVEWEEGPDSRRLIAISNLLNAKTTKEARMTGILWFEIPAILSDVIRRPYHFSRLRIHFMLGLSGKYAVTLYMLLESVTNLRTPVLDVNLGQLREWLKVPDGKLTDWYDLKRRAVEPAIRQININPTVAGFSVRMEEVKDGRAVARVRFIVTKTVERLDCEAALHPKPALPNPPRQTTSYPLPMLPPSAYEQAKKAARGWDIYALEQEWREWLATKENPDYSPASFVAFCKKRGPLR